MDWKRLTDLVVSAAVLILSLPACCLIAIAIVADSGFPVFYSQIRIGREFQEFRLWKFRSMYPNMTGTSITFSGDPRITRVGGLLRAGKLDELVQFWNVLKGDMSLVGPRPEIPEYVELFRDRYEKILMVRPGITDLASIQFRHEETVLARAADPRQEYIERILPAKLQLAEQYLQIMSPRVDFSILCKTVQSVLWHC